MAELENTNETKITSEIVENTTLNGTINAEVNGMQQQVMTMSCILTENSVANLQTYITNKDLFMANSQLVAAEVQKFRTKATEVGKSLNCFVF
ncbi:hypothetical protein [Clostridium perfringens]|uniref:hypothetical protein n=1 Tax=Clostridium perfringens TaxID=1502 RepID=UPI000D92E0EA|nr:hypothetical protein [Clostridium perfringens]UYC93787.1 hypothetical protein OEG88_04215 [Clostridium perfringens]CAG9359140.1 Uncharacterised protein [Clostridium perfringens]SQB35252.1 Uncharacterised protein [Clostridium perfringens]HAT4156632.1 hypothetical protein [Clostridium perfringens]